MTSGGTRRSSNGRGGRSVRQSDNQQTKRGTTKGGGMRLRWQEARQLTKQEGHDVRWRCDGRGAGRGGGEGAGGQQAAVGQRRCCPHLHLAGKRGNGHLQRRLGRQWRWWETITKAATGWWKNGSVYKILIFGKEAICPDGLFVPAIFRESDFYCNSLILTPQVTMYPKIWAK